MRDFVLEQPAAGRFLELVVELLELTVPAYRAEGKEQLRVALGCTGGYHRSIALAEELAERLGETATDASVSRLPPGAGADEGPAAAALALPGHAPQALAAARCSSGIAILGLGAAIFILDLYRTTAADQIAIVYWLTGAWLEPHGARGAGRRARDPAHRLGMWGLMR